MRLISQTFVTEINNAGLAGLPFSWGADGEFEFSSEITQQQKDDILAIYAAHNPNNFIAEYNEAGTDIIVTYSDGTTNTVPAVAADPEYIELQEWVALGNTIQPFETVLTLDEKKDKKIAFVHEKAKNKDYADISSGGKSFLGDNTFQWRIAILSNNGTVTSGTYAVPKKTGVDANLSYTELNDLFNALKTRAIAISAAKSAHIVNIKACTTKAEVSAYDISVNWGGY